MEGLIVFLVLLFLVLLVLPFVALAKASGARREVDDLRTRLRGVEAELFELRRVPRPAASETVVMETPGPAPKPAKTPAPEPAPAPARAAAVPPPLPASVTMPLSRPAPAEVRSEHKTIAKPAIDWEQFMGTKLFAWIGGLALFLGVAFFVKYSFEHDLISAAARVAIGFVVGLGLIAGGVMMKRKENVVTAQTLCATGILILYAVTFACHSFYRFPAFNLARTFLLMTMITAGAFALAVTLNAMVVAILGIAGGFLTPVLLSTGQDNPAALFGYIALLDVGLLLVARRKSWEALPILGAVGTVVMQVAWVGKFFVPQHYESGTKFLIPMAVFLGFELLFLAAVMTGKREDKADNIIARTAATMAVFALLWSFYFLAFPAIGQRPAILSVYLWLADVGLLALVWLRKQLSPLGGIAGIAAFIFLALWTKAYLTPGTLYIALGAYLVFGILHSATPLLLQRYRDETPAWWAQSFPAFTLLLIFLPILNLPDVSFLVWPVILIVDLLALAVAVFTGAILPVVAVLVLTFALVGSWIFRLPVSLTGLPTSLFLLGGFAGFFLLASGWAARRLLGTAEAGNGKLFGRFDSPANFSVQLPALSATLPFLLLIMMTVRLRLINPSPVFGLALLLVVLLLGMTRLMSLEPLPAVALLASLALELVWHEANFLPTRGGLPLVWYLAFPTVITLFPFLFHRHFRQRRLVWIASGLALPLHFFLVYDAVQQMQPNSNLGWLPALFILPSLAGLLYLRQRTPADSPARTLQLALFGGAALFFATLIFPIALEREWLTLGWALEGAALCWLFQRVPHPGLRLVGLALLGIAFFRLTMNEEVLSYHDRAGVPIFNWYLYVYGLVIAAFFAAAKFLAPPRNTIGQVNLPPVLYGLGTLLAFVLLNLEIADYFSVPGTTTLTFEFSGNFARDMTYSIAWALFALLLLIIGIRQRAAAARYASLGLLGLTLLKLFLHDLSQLEQLYRIGALVIVAIIAMVASYLYQRFLGAPARES